MQNTNFSCACGQIPPSLVLARFKCQYNTELTLSFRLDDKTLMTVIITIERSSEGARLHLKARPGGRFRVSASALPVADLNTLKFSRNHGVEGRGASALFPFFPPSSETQGLIAGTMQFFGRKFTSRAEEPLGTYSYRTSSRSGGNSVAFLHEVVFFSDQQSCLARATGRLLWRVSEKNIQRSRGNRKP